MVARLPTVSVRVLEDVAGFGLNDADTLPGKPEADKLTVPVNPFDGAMVMLDLPFVPREMLKVEGEAERLKFGPEVTVKEIVVVLVRFAQTPLIITVNVPSAAVALAVRVSVLLPAVPAGLKEAVTPLGRLEADKLTVPLKPLSGLMLMVLVAVFPWTALKLFGEAVKVKVPAGLTVRASEVCRVKLPNVPVIFMLAVPIVAVEEAVNVKALVPVVLVGLKEAVTPFGKPEADKPTAPLNPFCGVRVIVVDPLVPCTRVKPAGAAESVKFCVETGQLFTRLVALTVPIPVAKSQPVLVP